MRKLLPMLLLLAGCQSPTPTASAVPTNDFCLIASPILWSAKDTPETIKQIKKHNAQGIAVCHWKPN